MSNLQKSNPNSKKRKKSEAEEMLEITEEIMGSREPLNFSSYQQQVMLQTPIWPIEDPDYVFEKIAVMAKSAIGADKFAATIQAALILRALSEFCDYVPLSMERLANISVSQLPEKQPRIESKVEINQIQKNYDNRRTTEAAQQPDNQED